MRTMPTADPTIITPDWPAPANVRAAQTTRQGGVSRPPFESLNLGGHVGDDPADVSANRALLQAALALPAEPVWLTQVHGIEVVPAAAGSACADASWADRPGVVCSIMTADCLPVLLCDDSGEVVAAAHAGWRGLVAGVLEATVAAMHRPPQRLLAWLGPAIGPRSAGSSSLRTPALPTVSSRRRPGAGWRICTRLPAAGWRRWASKPSTAVSTARSDSPSCSSRTAAMVAPAAWPA